MVEVEGEERNKGGTEERMVGVDLDKGLILEIKISTGETFARHRLGKRGRKEHMFSCQSSLKSAL